MRVVACFIIAPDQHLSRRPSPIGSKIDLTGTAATNLVRLRPTVAGDMPGMASMITATFC